MTITSNPIVSNCVNAQAEKNRVVCNGIGDCFSDATHALEDAYKRAGSRAANKMINDAKTDVAYVKDYEWADAEDIKNMNKCLSAIAKAASAPTAENIKAARWECEKARARADGGSPRRAFWNSKVTMACNAIKPNFNGPAAKKAKEYENKVGEVIKQTMAQVSKIRSEVSAEYSRQKTLDPNGAFLLDEMMAFIDTLRGKLDDAW